MKTTILILLTIFYFNSYSQDTIKIKVGGNSPTYTANSPVIITGNVVSVDTAKSSGKLATYDDLLKDSLALVGEINKIKDTFYILAPGQSNSSGAAYGQYVDTARDVRVEAWDSITNKWVIMTVGQRPFFVLSSVSAQFFLAKKIARERNCIVRVVNYAKGGLTIDKWHNGTTPQYILRAIDTASWDGKVPKYDLVVWDQGESDSATPDSTYTARWDSIKAYWRRSVYLPTATPIVVVGLPSNFQNALNGFNLKDNLLRGFDYNTDPYDGYATTDSIKLMGDQLHFTGLGLKKLGEEVIWQTWKSLPGNYASTVKQWGYRDSTLFSLNKGNVGIGTVTPVRKLDVDGDIKVKYGLYNYKNSLILHTGDRDTTAPVFTRQSIFVGANAGNQTFQGIDNVGVGILSLGQIGSGLRNTAVGKAAGFSNISGTENINIGNNNLGGNGYHNVSINSSAGGGTLINPSDSNQLEISNYIIGKKGKLVMGNLGFSNNNPLATLHVQGSGLFTDTLTAITTNTLDSSDRVATTAFVKRQGYGGGGGGSYTETDPIVRAINGIIKSDGSIISAAVAGTDYVVPAALADYVTLNTAQTITGAKTYTSPIKIGSGTAIGTPSLNALGNKSAVEWGATTLDGFHSTLGWDAGTGRPYIGFNVVSGTNDDTYKTSGIMGTVIKSDNNGALLIGNTPLSSADNQPLIYTFIVKNDGSIYLGDGTSNSKFHSNALANETTIPIGVTGKALSSSAPNGLYGLTSSISGVSGDYMEQVQRFDGSSTTYNRILQPNGGNVGIGSYTATEKLDVAGNINTTGQLKLSGVAATNGQYLSHNGTTNVWVTPPSYATQSALNDTAAKFVPLAGTRPGKPVTGVIRLEHEDGGDIKHIDLSGENIIAVNRDNTEIAVLEFDKISLSKFTGSFRNELRLNNRGLVTFDEITLKNDSLIINSSGTGYYSDNSLSKGVFGGQDFSANYTANTYTQKVYVDKKAGATGYTVATLPGSAVIGDRAYVTDATSPTYLGALTGGGSVVTPVFFNGTIWVSH